jgi:putative transposon-encoded protein
MFIIISSPLNNPSYYVCTLYVHSIWLIHYIALSLNIIERNKYIYNVHIIIFDMVRRMKATITQVESVVTPSGNSGHVVVPKAWIGKEAIVTLKEKEKRRSRTKR